jgi:hypothetical protein
MSLQKERKIKIPDYLFKFAASLDPRQSSFYGEEEKLISVEIQVRKKLKSLYIPCGFDFQTLHSIFECLLVFSHEYLFVFLFIHFYLFIYLFHFIFIF